MVLRTLRGILKVILVTGNQGCYCNELLRRSRCQSVRCFLAVISLMLSPITCDNTKKWENPYHKLPIFYSCLLAPEKVSLTSSISNQDILSPSRQPLETNFCRYPPPFFLTHLLYLIY